MAPSISLTMIVKNEEADLAACLASARPLVDELVVVDTGSTDRTREIARQHGARVVDFAWADDFAAARNAGLAHATGDWVLVLDADEVVHERAPGALRRELAAQPPDVLFLRVPVREPLPGGGQALYRGRRLARRQPGVRWVHPIHEALTAEGDGPEREAAAAALWIDHRHRGGPAGGRARGKIERNIRLLERELAGRPGDPDLLRLVAREYLALGDDEAALARARLALAGAADARHRALREAIWGVALRAAMRLRRHEVAAEALAAEGDEVGSPELCYLIGCALQGAGDLDAAERMLERARARRDAAVPFAADAEAGGWKALHELGAIAWARGQPEAAVARWRAAQREAPDQPVPNWVLGRVLLDLGQAEEARGFLERATEAEPALDDAQLRLCRALAALGEHQAAYERLDRLTRERPEVAPYWEALGDLLVEAEEWLAAADALGRAVQRHERARLYALLGQALERLGRAEDAANARRVAARLGAAG